MIGIITFINENNYGAVLQAYAMQEFLKNNGYISEFVNIKLEKYTNKKESLFVKLAFYRKAMAFKKFRKQLRISSNENISKYEAIIVGSDQIWNPRLTGNNLQPIFFGLGAKQRVIAYACSCGNTNVLKEYEIEFEKYIKYVSNISVREKSFQEYLRKLIKEKVDVVLDPVFLLKEDQWRQFIGDSLLTSKVMRYIFVYLLEDNSNITDAINEISEKYNLKVITLRNLKHYKNEVLRLPDADPHKFLQLLSNAEIIVSNSFHALVFSYILKKKIALFRHTHFNDRISDMMELFCLTDEMYYDNAKKIIDFSEKSYIGLIDDEVKKSRIYLKNALQDI
jgi:hypothetical protein